jgi:BMFP domain-containing protein YqiC
MEGGAQPARTIVMEAPPLEAAALHKLLQPKRVDPIVLENFNPDPKAGAMTQTTNRFFDEIARLMNDAAGVASGVRREVETVFRSQAERILRDLDVVKREEFEAVKEMARLAREENEALKARIAALEAKLGSSPGQTPPQYPPQNPPQYPPPPPGRTPETM